ncbi:MAG TPA: aspartyl protease family protein [Caulobacteraceae bacterium]
MAKRSTLAALALVAAFLWSGPALAACVLGKIAELPVTMDGLRPMVAAKINDADALFIADSGAYFSVLSPASAARFGLILRPAPANWTMAGAGGPVRIWVTTAKRFTLVGVTFPNVDFIVGGSAFGVEGLLGQNVLGMADAEYDLANGVVRLMRPTGCGDRALAYWAASQPFSAIDIASITPLTPHTTAAAWVDGVKMRVIFDTGAPTSVLTLGAARRAGIDPGGAGVVPAGLSSGIGGRAFKTWIAPVASFKIGDEEVRNTRLRIGDTTLINADMLLGADFFLSHRIYVSRTQRKLYFTYNGGPVFNLTARTSVQAGTAPPTASVVKPDVSQPAPTDAAGFARRGAAFAARGNFAQAAADLTRASELAPQEADYFYQRGLALVQDKQPALAMAAFDRALKLAPADVPALLARAQLRLAGRDETGAVSDLDAADRLAEKQSALRLRLAELYSGARAFPRAIAQYDLWMQDHPRDGRRVMALNARCWARALWGQELRAALADCDSALKMLPNNPNLLDSRGLVRLRLGDLDGAIADYDAALSLRPNAAWSLYGRGLAELKKGMNAKAKSDIDAAVALQPALPDQAKSFGLAP